MNHDSDEHLLVSGSHGPSPSACTALSDSISKQASYWT